jgi:hypothetical protein
MKDEWMQPLLDAWFHDRDEAARDASGDIARVMADVPRTRQPGRWWPLPAFDRPVSMFPSRELAPAPIPATNGPRPARGFTMFSALKFIAAGVIVALFGGFLLAGILTTPSEEMAPAAVSASPELSGGTMQGRLYETYHSSSYDAAAVDADIDALRADPAVKSNKGIYEYLLGGKTDPKLLDVRLFDDTIKVAAYEQQTQQAKTDGVSNCPICAVGTDANKTRIYGQGEMDADHVTAWSKGGQSTLDNCAMLCVTHNRAKGNR